MQITHQYHRKFSVSGILAVHAQDKPNIAVELTFKNLNIDLCMYKSIRTFYISEFRLIIFYVSNFPQTRFKINSLNINYSDLLIEPHVTINMTRKKFKNLIYRSENFSKCYFIEWASYK